MRRSVALLTALLAVQLGIAALLAMRHNPLASIPPQSPLIGPAAQKADHLIVEGSPSGANHERVEIARRNGQWVLPGYFNAPADKFKVEDLLSELAALQRGLPIATSRSALERFKIAEDDFERRLILAQGDRTLSTVYLGSSAGARRTDARTAADRAVYSVELATYELPTQPSAWFANDLLESQPAQLSGVDIQTPQSALHLARQTAGKSASWSATDLPAGAHLDPAKAESLTQDIGELRLQGVMGTNAQPDWQQTHPLLKLTLHSMQRPSQSWVISQPEGANYYVLKSSSQPWYFSVDASTGKQLLDAAAPATLLGTAKGGAPTAATPGTPPRGRILTIHPLPARKATHRNSPASAH